MLSVICPFAGNFLLQFYFSFFSFIFSAIINVNYNIYLHFLMHSTQNNLNFGGEPQTFNFSFARSSDVYTFICDKIDHPRFLTESSVAFADFS